MNREQGEGSMNAKHTPGTWTAFGTIAKCGLDVVAECPMELGGVYAIDTAKANARLIAAAPELYEALRDMVESSQPPALAAEGIARAPSRAVLSIARAALAKVDA
jgi:hypothetical protein